MTDVKRIPLTQGKYALVDDSDYQWLSQFKWRANHPSHTWYASTNLNGKAERMHRMILRLSPGDKRLADHIDGNGLNNQRSNLRIVTCHQNNYNAKPVGGTSDFKGVSWDKKSGKWKVQIHHHKRNIWIGLFIDEIEAAHHYDEKAKELFGEFAYLNFPQSAIATALQGGGGE